MARVSIIYSTLVLVGIVLIVLGAAAALLGIGGTTAFEISWGDIKAKSSQTGLSIMVVGALIAVITTTRTPKGVRILSADLTPKEKAANWIKWVLLAVIIIGLLLLAYTILAR